MSDLPSRAAFAETLNSSYQVFAESGRLVEIMLCELNDGRSSPRHEQFALLFRGPRDPIVPQGQYRLAHATLDCFDLFLVPVGRDDQGTYYEAIFNRLIETT